MMKEKQKEKLKTEGDALSYCLLLCDFNRGWAVGGTSSVACLVIGWIWRWEWGFIDCICISTSEKAVESERG